MEVAHLCVREPPDRFAEAVDAVARAYPGLLAVERNNHGHAVLLRLRQLAAERPTRYQLFHEEEPLAVPVGGRLSHRNRGKPGWLTTSATKGTLITDLEEALRKGLIALGTRAVVQELRIYQRDPQGKTAAPAGKHDDRVMALALAWRMRQWVTSQRQVYRPVAITGTA